MCQRAGCTQSASVTLSFRYDARQASLVDLLPEKHPALYDLCDAHADLLIVPRGWERLDRRELPAPTPHAAVATIAAAAPPPATDMDRYAALTAQLPQLAESLGSTRSDKSADGDDGDRGVSHDLTARGRGADRPTPPQWSAAARSAERPRGPLFETTSSDSGSTLLHDDVLDGQLQMPIEPESQGVVVALTRPRKL
ncbi:hypothetical protein BH23ACT10_BH23ACT10_35910 [soil metagenome]